MKVTYVLHWRFTPDCLAIARKVHWELQCPCYSSLHFLAAASFAFAVSTLRQNKRFSTLKLESIYHKECSVYMHIHTFSFLICRRGYSCWALGEADITYTYWRSEPFSKAAAFFFLLPYTVTSEEKKYEFKPEKYYFRMLWIVSRARQILTYIFLLNM